MKSRKWLVIIILLVLAYVAWKYLWPRGEDRSDAARDSSALVLDRVWVDSHPEAYTDYVQAMLMLSDIPMGVFQKASAYHMELEVFEFKRKGNKVRVHFPQSKAGKQFSYKVHRCDDLPPFDLCLDVSKNPWQGPTRYYSLSDDQRLEALDSLESQLRSRLRTAR